MKRSFRVLELTKNEQRVVLFVMFALVAISFFGYERRIHPPSAEPTSATDAKPSPTPIQTGDEQ